MLQLGNGPWRCGSDDYVVRKFPDRVSRITEGRNTGLLKELRDNLRCLSWEERDAARDRLYDLVINLEDSVEVGLFLETLQFKQLFGAYVGSASELRYTAELRLSFDLSLISVHGREAADSPKLQNRCTYQELFFDGLGLEFRAERYLLPEPVRTGLRGDIVILLEAGPVWPMTNWAFYNRLKEELEAMGPTVNVLKATVAPGALG
jgi:hypothetical protein